MPKRYKKVIHSSQAFNSATTTKYFAMRDAVYYLLANGKIEKFKPLQKVVISAMNDNADKVQAFIKSSKLILKATGIWLSCLFTITLFESIK